MTQQELINEYNEWRAENGLNPLTEKSVSVLLGNTVKKCFEMIDKHKASAIEKLPVPAPAPTPAVAVVVMPTPAPSDDEESDDDASSQHGGDEEGDKDGDEQDAELDAELDTIQGLKKYLLAVMRRSDKQNERIIQLEKEVAMLKNKKPKKTTERGTGKVNIHGECQYIFTKGASAEKVCGRQCIPSQPDGDKERYCIQHAEYVQVANVEGYVKPRRVERDDAFKGVRCKHLFTFGAKKGMGCQRLGQEKLCGYCNQHKNDATKK